MLRAPVGTGMRVMISLTGPPATARNPTLVEIPPLAVEHLVPAHRSAGAHEFLGLLHPIALKELQLKLVGEGVLALTDKPFRETDVRRSGSSQP